MKAKLIFVNNPHDVKSRNLKLQFEKTDFEGQEKTVIDFDKLKNILPIRVAPCTFILGTEELEENFTIDNVKESYKFLTQKETIKSQLDAIGKQLVQEKLKNAKNGGV